MKRILAQTALEFGKLRGTGLWLVALLSSMAAIFLSLYLVVADQGTDYTFGIFAGNIISNTQSDLLPCTVAFLLGQMMERERTCGTLKNLLAVPLTFRHLLAVKAAACAVMTLLYSVAQWTFALAAACALDLPGLDAATAGRAFACITGSNLCVYLAVLPVAALGTRYAGGYAPATAFALFYGFFGSMISTRRWGVFYPTLAGSVLFPLEGAPQPGKAACALAALGLMTVLGVLLITNARDHSR
ncbi:MAG: ABC transporter permease [Blautia massiliensis (ex Durand et al. 2017)]